MIRNTWPVAQRYVLTPEIGYDSPPNSAEKSAFRSTRSSVLDRQTGQLCGRSMDTDYGLPPGETSPRGAREIQLSIFRAGEPYREEDCVTVARKSSYSQSWFRRAMQYRAIVSLLACCFTSSLLSAQARTLLAPSGRQIRLSSTPGQEVVLGSLSLRRRRTFIMFNI